MLDLMIISAYLITILVIVFVISELKNMFEKELLELKLKKVIKNIKKYERNDK